MFEKPDVKIAVLVGITLAFLLAIGNLYWHMEHMRVEMASLRHSVLDEVTKLTDATHQAQANNSRRAPATAVESNRKVLDSLNKQLRPTTTTPQPQAPAPTPPTSQPL